MSKFFSFTETGDLNIEKVFLDMGEPILFVCKGQKGKRYLVVCCQSNVQGKKWLLAETNIETIVRMLEDKITIREAFLIVHGEKYTIIQNVATEPQIILHDPSDWDEENSIYLPDAGEYMEAEPGEFDEEINWYGNLLGMMWYAQTIYKSPPEKRSFEINMVIQSGHSLNNNNYNVMNVKSIKCTPHKDNINIIDDRLGPYAA